MTTGILPQESAIPIKLEYQGFSNIPGGFAVFGTGGTLSAGGVITPGAANDRSAGLRAARIAGLGLVPAKNGPISLRGRIWSELVTAKALFFGFSSHNMGDTDIADIATIAANSISGATNSPHLAGLLTDDDLTDPDLADKWLGLFRGGPGGSFPAGDAIGKAPYKTAAFAAQKYYDLTVEIGRGGYVHQRVNGIPILDREEAVDPNAILTAYVFTQNRTAAAVKMVVEYLCLEAHRESIES